MAERFRAEGGDDDAGTRIAALPLTTHSSGALMSFGKSLSLCGL